MARSHPVVNDHPEDYEFQLPLFDSEVAISETPKGSYSKLYGIDGRFVGEFRRFPGMKQFVAIPETIGGNSITVGGHSTTLFEYFSIQDTRAAIHTLTGFIFLGRDGNDEYLYATYYTTRSSSWESARLTTAKLGDNTSPVQSIDITTTHRQIVVAYQGNHSFTLDGVATKLFGCRYISGSNSWVNYSLQAKASLIVADNGDEHALRTTDVTTETNAAHLIPANKTVVVALRHCFKSEDVTFRISSLASPAAPGTNYRVALATRRTDGTNPMTAGIIKWSAKTGFTDRNIELWRSLSSNVTDINLIGRLYLENTLNGLSAGAAQVTDVAYWGSGTGTTTTVGLSDDGLQLATKLDKQEASVVDITDTTFNAVAFYEDMLFVSERTSGQLNQFTESGLNTLRWSPVALARLNLFPVDNKRRPKDLKKRIKQFLDADPFLIAVFDNQIMRIHKSGITLSVDSVHNRFGTKGRFGSIAVGTTVFITSPVGILMIEMSAQPNAKIVGVTRNLFTDKNRWGADLENIHAGFDGEAAAVVWLNTAKEEALIYWSSTGVFTQIADMTFSDLAVGPDPVNGGHDRTFFLSPYQRAIYVMNVNGDAPTQTMNGGAITVPWNGTTTEGSSLTTAKISLEDGEAVSDDLVGSYIYFLSGTNVFEKRRITSVTAPDMVHWTTDLPTTLESGTAYSLAPVVIDIRCSPLMGGPDRTIRDLFRGQLVTSMQTYVQYMSGDTGETNPNRKIIHRVYNAHGDKLLDSSAALDLDPDDCGSATPVNGKSLIPGLANYDSNVYLELKGLTVHSAIGGD